jgi:phosphopantothenoylcysteine decarboxylase/phosphopantothenate--cysteine ligase
MSIHRIVLGVSGGIAAYKSALLVRELVKADKEVRVIMTNAATEFIGPVTLSSLSKNPVLTEINQDGDWNNHVELGQWADLMLIAPATANTIAKMANGQCDNLLMAVYLSAKCPVAVAPAMDLDMYTHSATQKNLNIIQEYGVKIIGPENGALASGLKGMGRMTEPKDIIKAIL